MLCDDNLLCKLCLLKFFHAESTRDAGINHCFACVAVVRRMFNVRSMDYLSEQQREENRCNIVESSIEERLNLIKWA